MTTQTPSPTLVQAVAVTAELCGRTFTESAARMFVSDLASYPEAAVLASLARCRREVRGALTLADVIARIDDGRPTADEAWAEIPQDERGSVVWSDEMREAWGLASDLLAAGDMVAARMAFRDNYNRLVARARDERRPLRWSVSLGHETHTRHTAIRRAVEKGRLTEAAASLYLPAGSLPAAVPRIGAGAAAAAAVGAIATWSGIWTERANAPDGAPEDNEHG